MAVYFVQSIGDGDIKIGYSTQLVGRLRCLRISLKKKLKLLGIIPGHLSEEQKIHKKFAHLRIEGEWFRPSEELLDFIENNTIMAVEIFTATTEDGPVTISAEYIGNYEWQRITRRDNGTAEIIDKSQVYTLSGWALRNAKKYREENDTHIRRLKERGLWTG